MLRILLYIYIFIYIYIFVEYMILLEFIFLWVRIIKNSVFQYSFGWKY